MRMKEGREGELLEHLLGDLLGFGLDGGGVDGVDLFDEFDAEVRRRREDSFGFLFERSERTRQNLASAA